MARNFLKMESLPEFLGALLPFGELHGPVLTEEGVTAFRPIRSPADILLDYSRTLIPPKKYLIHPKETLLAFAPQAGYRLPEVAEEEIVLFGVHPCDLAGIAYLDRVFMGEGPDPLYSARRKALTLIGLSCEPDEYCFCGDVGCAVPHTFDIFLERSAEGFIVTAGSEKGEEILLGIRPLLVERRVKRVPPGECGIFGDIRGAVARKETFEGSPLWDAFASRCLSCGACSLCCPTCYCFDVREYGNLDGETAERIREWDNCLFRSHGEVAGGHNFRKTRTERFRYRYQHKYLGFGPTRGTLSCVGCGRCREVCPVRIDLLELFNQSS